MQLNSKYAYYTISARNDNPEYQANKENNSRHKKGSVVSGNPVMGSVLQSPLRPGMILYQRKKINIRGSYLAIDRIFKRMIDILDEAHHVDKYLCEESDQDDPGDEVLKPGDEQ